MSRSETFLIVGGGIAGLTSAAALAQQGFKVTLLEAAPEFGEIGAGLTITPNAMKGLDFISACERVTAVAVEPGKQRFTHWQDGRTLVSIDRSTQREKYGAPYITVHRADIHEELLAVARESGVELRANSAVVATEGTTAILADGTRISADCLIGADGVKSVVRQRFGGEPPYFTGHVAWRCLIPVTPGVQDLSDWPGIIIGPGGMIARYNVRKSTILNLVFFRRQEGWTDDGWTIVADPDEMRRAYAGWCDDAQRLIEAACKQRMYKWAINARRPIPSWIVDGNVTLVGDAAHGMTPFLGQGATSAIEDAIVLARAMAASSSITEGLTRYEKARHERATFIQLESNTNADRMQGQDTDLFGVEGMKDEESLGLFHYDPRTVEV
jgi:salicylate hydroxylase